ncbi:Protein NO VEIN C-terminal domain-containing protein [Vibrio crassostreae]|nr:Protein NO VEIN C-terminal domain-containing protein [Vibrio crassostreae]CAK3585058.1 Protein NO VEIN C-terminal domain-containing protein [Vibrio crassostreae]
MDNSWIPESSEEWFEWLTTEESKTRNSYFAKPVNLIHDYGSERATKIDYEGREVLELLQNAADQAKDSNESGRVVIELTHSGMVIANTGNAFSVGGIQSLQNAHLSPKRLGERKFIGCKGLGFRSILNWTVSPIIFSGSLALAYSRKVTEEKLKALISDNEELAELVTKETKKSNLPVLPVLPFPGYSIDNDIHKFIDECNYELANRCLDWKSKGYTTAIAIPFNNDDIYDKALQQLSSLRPETLLFVDSLDELHFLLPNEQERVWSKDGDDTVKMVLTNDSPIGIWQVFKTGGDVPEEYLNSDQNDNYSYELIIAVPEVEKVSELKSSPLFSYFPTEITIPLPIVCSATLELTQDRNNITKHESNGFVLECLAEFIAEVAEQRAREHPTGIKAGFRNVMPIGEFPLSLINHGFPGALLDTAKNRQIIPTLSGTAIKPNEAYTINGASNGWLPTSGFEDLTPANNDEHLWFKKVGVKEMSADLLKERICSITDLPLNDRVKFIVGLKAHNISAKAFTSSLFWGSNGKPIPDSTSVYISPKDALPEELPSWLTLRFLDIEMQKLLTRELEVKDARELQVALKDFGLHEYSFGRLLQHLIAQSNRRKKKDPDNATRTEKELFNLIYLLYKKERKAGQLPVFPAKANFELPNQNGSSTRATEMYMGNGYLDHGYVMQSLYGDICPEQLLLPPEQFSICDDINEFCGFLAWIGVSKWPREVTIKESNKNFLESIIAALDYPVKFEDYIFSDDHELKSARVSVKSYVSVDKLGEILVPDKYPAIIAWLCKDERFYNWSRPSSKYLTVSSIRSGDRNYRTYYGPLPSYIIWKIANTAWLKDKDSKPLMPRECVIGERAIESIFPRPAKFTKQLYKAYSLLERELTDAWRRAGVITSLVDLNINDIYERLIEFPTNRPSGQHSQSLYRWVLDAVEVASGDPGISKDRFLSKGRMWGTKGGVSGYYAIEDLHHADFDGLPKELLDRLAIVALPHRVGTDKVKRVFGVTSIDRLEIKQSLKSHFLADMADDIDVYFQLVKPHFKLLRATQSSQKQHLGLLEKLRIVICSEISAEMIYEGTQFSYDLPVWGWLIENHTLYIRTGSKMLECDSDLLADTIGSVMASVFRVADGGEFARLFRCKPKDRNTLLRRMRGDKAEEVDMDILEALAEDTFGVLPDIGIIQEPTAATVPSSRDYVPQKPTEPASKQVSPIDGPLKDKPLEITQVASPQPKSTKKQKLRVQVKTSGSTSSTSYVNGYQITDGNFAESKVMEIESNFEPPRYPLRVGQIVGSESFGCDILSFDTEEKRDRFQKNIDRKWDQVARFIEVKGRKHNNAEIELRGNEKTAAKRYKDKYFLYRLHKVSDENYLLSILQNPLADSAAIEQSVYVNLDKSENKDVFEVTGGN